MQNSFRLKSNDMFSRPEEENQEAPLRIVFLTAFTVTNWLSKAFFIKFKKVLPS